MSTISDFNRFNCFLGIEAPHWTSMIRVHDYRWQEVGRSCGALSFELPSGIYEVEATLGLEKQSRLIAVRPGERTVISAGSWNLKYRSAAPLRGTSTTLAAHEEGASRWSRQITWGSDAESRLFVFVRSLNNESSLREDRGLRLLSVSGEIINDFSTGVYIDDESNYLALTCDLPPGPYILHTKKPFRYQPLWLSPGYETQVFIPFAELLSLDEISVFMMRRGEGFSPDNEKLISAELIRHRLQRRQEPLLVNDYVWREMSQAALDNPWLCLLLAHAMHDLAQSATDEILEFIPSNDGRVIHLVNLLKHFHPELDDHPDVRALTLSKDEPASKPFDFPPMLWRSLKLVQRHAASYFETIPLGSFTDRVLDSLLLDSGWSAWQQIDSQPAYEKDEASYNRLLEEAYQHQGEQPLYQVRQQAYEDSMLMRLAQSRSFDEQQEVLWMPENDLSRELENIESSDVSRECGITRERARTAISFLQKHPGLIMQPEILSPSTQAAALYVWDIHERATNSPDERSSNSLSLEEVGRRLWRASEEFIRLSTLSEQLAGGFPLDSETAEFFKSTLKEFTDPAYREHPGINYLIEQFEKVSERGETIQDDGLTASWLRFQTDAWAWSLSSAANRLTLTDNAILIMDADGRFRAANFALRYILNQIVDDKGAGDLQKFVEWLSRAPLSWERMRLFDFLPFRLTISRSVAVKRAGRDEVLAYLYLLRTNYYRPIDPKMLHSLNQLIADIALHQTLIEYGTPQQRPAYLRAMWQYMGQLFFTLEFL